MSLLEPPRQWHGCGGAIPCLSNATSKLVTMQTPVIPERDVIAGYWLFVLTKKLRNIPSLFQSIQRVGITRQSLQEVSSLTI